MLHVLCHVFYQSWEHVERFNTVSKLFRNQLDCSNKLVNSLTCKEDKLSFTRNDDNKSDLGLFIETFKSNLDSVFFNSLGL